MLIVRIFSGPFVFQRRRDTIDACRAKLSRFQNKCSPPSGKHSMGSAIGSRHSTPGSLAGCAARRGGLGFEIQSLSAPLHALTGTVGAALARCTINRNLDPTIGTSIEQKILWLAENNSSIGLPVGSLVHAPRDLRQPPHKNCVLATGEFFTGSTHSEHLVRIYRIQHRSEVYRKF